jgi:regulator of protease activity HflC (stomatin/prohibitin superfamily)
MGLPPLLVVGLVVTMFAVVTVVQAVRIVPQARARNVERLGRYHRTLQPGLSIVIPYVDRVYPPIDLREQVVAFSPQPVITEDNLVVEDLERALTSRDSVNSRLRVVLDDATGKWACASTGRFPSSPKARARRSGWSPPRSPPP